VLIEEVLGGHQTPTSKQQQTTRLEQPASMSVTSKEEVNGFWLFGYGYGKYPKPISLSWLS
jgi:hypothetical protein